MISKIREKIGDLGKRNETLAVDSRYQIHQHGGEVGIAVDRPDTTLTLVTDDGNLTIGERETERSFKRSYLEEINAVVKHLGSVVYSFSEESDFSFTVTLSADQLGDLSEINIEHTNALMGDNQFTVDVCKIGSLWSLQVTGFHRNTSPFIKVRFDDKYPEVIFRDKVRGDELNVDLSDIQSKDIELSIPSHITGEMRIDSSRVEDISEYKENNEFALDGKIYHTEDDDFDDLRQAIEEWHEKSVTVEVYPDEYAPCSKTKSGTDLQFLFSDFEELATLELEYPEWGVAASPQIEYGDLDYWVRSKYSSRETVGKNTFRFTKVIPNVEFDIHNGADLFHFEDRLWSAEPLDAGEMDVRAVDMRVDSQTSFYINTDTEVFANINGDMSMVSEREKQTVRAEETSIEIKDPDGNVVFTRVFNRQEVANLVELTVAENEQGLTVYVDSSTVDAPCMEDYTYD